jgi:hypothetical protein
MAEKVNNDQFKLANLFNVTNKGAHSFFLDVLSRLLIIECE